MKTAFVAVLGALLIAQPAMSFADNSNGKNLYVQRCAVCHGADIKGTGPLAHKSNPPTPDLTTSAFKQRLHEYPGVIVSSIILRPNGNLIPKTLKENGVKIPPHAWSVKELRDLHEYMSGVISIKR
ncbi:cytochrome c [Pseudomonas sp. P155]|uniref:Cytochrome c n=1 Tax=Pseudomonas neuropathica TaxID=2730425 RepID=A0ABS0BPH9_9PSED|nr:cytochrome c [Pseudomonas neuropathica]MBF6036345.1 cytochrome c [Pseudomonas neuropathica]